MISLFICSHIFNFSLSYSLLAFKFILLYEIRELLLLQFITFLYANFIIISNWFYIIIFHSTFSFLSQRWRQVSRTRQTLDLQLKSQTNGECTLRKELLRHWFAKNAPSLISTGSLNADIAATRCLLHLTLKTLPTWHQFFYYLLHGLGYTWPVPSSWIVWWSLYLNCGRSTFCFLSGLYVRIFFGIHLSSFRCAWYLHCDLVL
jgi:hypothetical protein